MGSRLPGWDEGLDALGVSLTVEQHQAFEAYVDLLMRWNRAMNLTAVRTREGIVQRHFLDSLSLLSVLPEASTVVDVGSGAGFPGVPLALVCPHWKMTLLEPNQKRVAFLRQLVATVGLEGVSVVCGRAGEIVPEIRYDGLVTRAVTDAVTVARWADDWVRPGGWVAVMKGQYPDAAECSALGEHEIHALEVPGLAARHVLLMTQDSSSAGDDSRGGESGEHSMC